MSETRRGTPAMFEERPWGVSTCGRRIGDRDCEQPATHHIAWDETLENGICCEKHYEEAKRAWEMWDSHPFGGFCLMPGTDWVASWEEPPGACVLPLDEEGVGEVLEAEVRAPVLTPAPS